MYYNTMFSLGQQIIYRNIENKFFIAWIIGILNPDNAAKKLYQICYYNKNISFSNQGNPSIYLFKEEDKEEYKYEILRFNSETPVLFKRVPYVYFILGRMNPPHPGHIEGLIIPFTLIVANHIYKHLINGVQKTDEISNDDFLQLSIENKSCSQLIEIVGSWELPQKLSLYEKNIIISNLQQLNNQILEEGLGIPQQPQDFTSIYMTPPSLSKITNFIYNYSDLVNIKFKIFLTQTNNKSRIEMLLKMLSNPELKSKSEKKFDDLTNFINFLPNAIPLQTNPITSTEQEETKNNLSIDELQSIFNDDRLNYLLGNPLLYEEKVLFLTLMLKNRGFKKKLIDKILNVNERNWGKSGIKSGILGALQVQLDSSDTYNPNKIIYYYSRDDGDSVREYCNSDVKKLLDKKDWSRGNIQIANIIKEANNYFSTSSLNLAPINIETPNINCVVLNRSPIRGLKMSASLLKESYLLTQNANFGFKKLNETYIPKGELGEEPEETKYLAPDSVNCLNDILSSRLLFFQREMQQIIDTITTIQSSDQLCPSLISKNLGVTTRSKEEIRQVSPENNLMLDYIEENKQNLLPGKLEQLELLQTYYKDLLKTIISQKVRLEERTLFGTRPQLINPAIKGLESKLKNFKKVYQLYKYIPDFKNISELNDEVKQDLTPAQNAQFNWVASQIAGKKHKTKKYNKKYIKKIKKTKNAKKKYTKNKSKTKKN